MHAPSCYRSRSISHASPRPLYIKVGPLKAIILEIEIMRCKEKELDCRQTNEIKHEIKHCGWQ